MVSFSFSSQHVSMVSDEYKEVFGTSFPLQDLGYNNFHDFLRNHPEDFVFYGDNVLPVSKTSSVHIENFVNNQKPGKKRSSKVQDKSLFYLLFQVYIN